MRRINLIYWNKANFGDALNPLLIAELSGLPIQYKDIELSLKERIIFLFRSIFLFRFKKLQEIIFPWQHTLVAVGSIIHWGNQRSNIWGAGFMNRTDQFKGGKLFAVRGKLTDRKLSDDGFQSCGVYGDPALLLPLWIDPVHITPKHSLGIVPHWSEVDEFERLYGDRYRIIDLRTQDIEKVVHEICCCDMILSTSLHGLIVAHAYQIPALWIQKGYIETDGFKFEDYFSSVGIPSYVGFRNIEELLHGEGAWAALFEQYKDRTLVKVDLEELQRKLLSVAPFPLKQKYRAFKDQ